MYADIAERRRVWLALSDMFLDTDTAQIFTLLVSGDVIIVR